MNVVVNGLLWFGIFAIPMLIAVILRVGPGTAWATAGTLLRSPTTEGGHESLSAQRATARAHSPAGVGIVPGRSAVGDDARPVERVGGCGSCPRGAGRPSRQGRDTDGITWSATAQFTATSAGEVSLDPARLWVAATPGSTPWGCSRSWPHHGARRPFPKLVNSVNAGGAQLGVSGLARRQPTGLDAGGRPSPPFVRPTSAAQPAGEAAGGHPGRAHRWLDPAHLRRTGRVWPSCPYSDAITARRRGRLDHDHPTVRRAIIPSPTTRANPAARPLPPACRGTVPCRPWRARRSAPTGSRTR